MSRPVVPDAVPDVAAPFEATLPVLGVPVRLRSDRAEVIEVFERAFGYWRVLETRPELIAGEPVEGVLTVTPAAASPAGRARVEHEVLEGRRLAITMPGGNCLSDAGKRSFVGSVPEPLVRDADHFRYHVLEALVLSVVTWLDRTPVHASAVVRDDTALLLTGPSGRGKSTLTWAAAGAGLRILADDMVFVQMDPPRVWGMPTFLHLPAESRRFFPQLATVPVTLASSGKEKLALDLRARGAAAAFPVAARMGICVLERSGAAAPAWRRLAAVELGAAMARLDPGFDLFAERYPALVAELAARGGWAFEVGTDPHAAARALHDVLDLVEEGGR